MSNCLNPLKLWPLPGGIHPPQCKSLSSRAALQQAPLPKRLVLPLEQAIGAPAEPLVVVGERVLKGQLLSKAAAPLGTALHAPTSGTVSFIGLQPYPHASNLPAQAIVIDSDGLEQWTTLHPCPDYLRLSTQQLLEKIHCAGICGLGGAGFPTAAKLRGGATRAVQRLLINGSECEPYITADDLLMRSKAPQLVAGIEVLVHLLQPQQVLIGIEDNKPEAIAAVRAAIGERPWSVAVFPSKYPSGGERQLIQIVSGLEVPSGGLPIDIGVLCLNVGSVVAVHDAVLLGQPLISRITTLTGQALARPMNVEALIGTPIEQLLAFAGLDRARLNRLIVGGPMMGFNLPDPAAPLLKTSNCLLAASAEELPPPPPAVACIRCGECAEVCPAGLLPQQLHFFAQGQEHQQLKAHNLFDCIECGACAYVCPSSIALVQSYRAAKGEIRELASKHDKAEQSRQRFEQRQERLRRAELHKETERQARAERAAIAKAAQANGTQTTPSGAQTQKPAGLSDVQKKLKIEASMAQVAANKAEKQLAAHPSPQLQAQVASLRSAALAAQQALETALAANPVSPAVVDPQLKQAKIALAMARAALKKAEQSAAPQAQQAALRTTLAAAEQALHQAEQASDKPAPQLLRIDKRPITATERALQSALAFARADLRKLARDPACSAQALQQARHQLAEAERQLSQHHRPD